VERLFERKRFFQWEFIFVIHYVRMWFTSCMIVGVWIGSRGAFLGTCGFKPIESFCGMRRVKYTYTGMRLSSGEGPSVWLRGCVEVWPGAGAREFFILQANIKPYKPWRHSGVN
jgi:hypothetical protein